MATQLDLVSKSVTSIKDIDSLLEYLDGQKLYVRVGHSNHSYDVTAFVDAGLRSAIKAHLGINLRRRRAELARKLREAALEV